jgi:hypothetical protein
VPLGLDATPPVLSRRRYLEQHSHALGVQAHALAVGQAQHAVVVQHCVHVLHPGRVHGAVKDHPMVFGPGGALGQRAAEHAAGQTVLPLACARVNQDAVMKSSFMQKESVDKGPPQVAARSCCG